MRRREFLGGSGVALALAASGCASRNQPDVKENKMDNSLIEKAFLYGYGPYEFSKTAGAALARGRAQNTLGHRTGMSGPKNRSVTAPNIDTLYSSAFLELSGGPMEVLTPEAPDRYHCVTFMNTFTDNFGILGTRTTGGHRVRAWVVGPDWQGHMPDDVRLIRSDTNDVWMLGRTLVDGPEDLDAARAVQAQFELHPVEGRGPARPLLAQAAPVPTAPMFLAAVNELLGRSPVDVGQARRAVQFAQAGILPGDMKVWDHLSDQLKASWSDGLPKFLDDLKSNSGILLPTETGWRAAPPEAGDFGENDALRAGVALWGLAALPAKEAGYFRATEDSSGAPLDGTKAYQFLLPPEGVPADAFWSITMYSEEPDGRYFLVENPIDRYAITDRTKGLTWNKDGSLKISIQSEQPADPSAAANWLPTPPGRFMVSFRAYLPRKEILEGDWSPPPLMPVDPG